MDPRIALSYRSPDIPGAIQQGQLNAARGQALQRQNALNQLFAQQGPQIMQGQPQALNNLARIDPGQATDIRAKLSQMSSDQIGMLQQQTERALAAMTAAKDPATWDRLATEMGAPQLVGRFGDKDALFRSMLTMKQALDQANGGGGPDAPSGYQWGDNGNLSYIPGGPADPAVREKLRGPGMTVYGENGKPIVTTGGGKPLGNKGQNDLDTRRINAGVQLARLNAIDESFNPEYQTLQKQVEMWGANWADKLGQATPEMQQQIAEYAVFKRRAFDNLNQTLREMSGAAITPQEADRLKQALPDPGTDAFSGDGPARFQAKLKDVIQQTKMALARYNYWSATGQVGSPQDIAPLEDMPNVIKKRMGELANEVKAAGFTDPAAIRQQVLERVKQEFGV